MGISLKNVRILEREREKEREWRETVRDDATRRGKEKVTGGRWKGETEKVKAEKNERRAA